jgi:Fusaric acid resistance protein family
MAERGYRGHHRSRRVQLDRLDGGAGGNQLGSRRDPADCGRAGFCDGVLPAALRLGFSFDGGRTCAAGTFAAVYFSVVSNIDNVMPYDSVGFLNTTIAILVGIGVELALFATFFPETSALADRRFRRQLLVGLSRFAGVRHPAIRAYEGALYERLASILGRLKDERNAARGCFAGAMTALSTARAIDGLRTAIGADRLPPAMTAGISSLRSSFYCGRHPMFAEIDLRGLRASDRSVVRGLFGAFPRCGCAADQGRLLPAVLAQTARALRSIRLRLLRGRTGLEHELIGRGLC